jgi:hypothetical protein
LSENQRKSDFKTGDIQVSSFKWRRNTNLKSLNDEQLVSETESAVARERKATTEVVRLFREIHDRELYLASGYSSFFAMVTEKFGYCNGSAQLRINAMWLIKDIPEVEAKIESGELSLTVAASVQSFLYREKREQRPYSQNAKIELVETCLEKSVHEVHQEFVRRNPEIEKRESVKAISPERIRISHSMSTTLEAKLQRIRLLWSHVDSHMSREDLLDRMAELTLDQIDPVRKAARAKDRKERASASKKDGKPLHSNEVAKIEVKKPTRYIRVDADRAVRVKNDDEGCEFVDLKTGKRCRSHHQLQRDHLEPFSHGGSNEPENLRLLCAQHNRWVWRYRSHVRTALAAYG